MNRHASRISELYERRARDYDRDRGRSLQERAWLDRFLAGVAPGGTVLDLGCGMGEPIAAYVLSEGRAVIGVDTSPSLIAMARERFPGAEWIGADMRALALGVKAHGLLAPQGADEPWGGADDFVEIGDAGGGQSRGYGHDQRCFRAAAETNSPAWA